MPLTGRFNLRRTMSGKIVLQVEAEVRRLWPFSRKQPTKRRWRDATLMDLAQPELRPLMDLRHKPGFEWLGIYGQLDPAQRTGAARMSPEKPPSLSVVPEPPSKANASAAEPRRLAA
ncbi:hypothetical protein [Microvirga thermotolerans]|uniref:Uncharacterized protein n=1 Tax=Microvirga thermotolerans TaxID=2651334 RepID=A0A5P9JWS1_9HYPH|nr:hypothetical protein [Microvirga thermotolerans]QFU16883.1 hypothetical protein GDR74_11965 [Microvirga thermotolerans]